MLLAGRSTVPGIWVEKKGLSPRPLRHRAVGHLLLLTFTTAAMLAPLGGPHWSSGVAYAQEADRPGQTPAVGIVPFVRKGDVGVLAAARIEEYLRQMLSAGDSLKPLPQKVVDTGKPLVPIVKESKEKPQSPAQKALDKADTLAATARTMVEENEDPADALKLLKAAAQRYEDNFVELVDFTKLVDVYSQAAQLSLALSDPKGAKELLEKAVVLQPTFVVDTRKASKPLQKVLTEARAGLANREGSNLTVDCSAAGADVFVDGVRVGNCPSVASDLLAGTHYVQVKKAGALPWGVIFEAKGKDASLNATLKIEEDATSIGLTVASEDIKAFAGSGNFHEKVFKNMAAMFSKQVGAQYLLYGVVSKSARNLELHMFLYQAKTKRTCALDKLEYQPTLGDLQMKTLDAEGRVRAAMTNCKEVDDLPLIFDPSRETGGEAREPIAAAPPVVEEEAPQPKVIRPEPKPQPKIRPQPKAEPEVDPALDPYAGLLHDEDETQKTPWYKKWWPWTILGVVVVGAVGGAVYAAGQTPAPATSFSATGFVP